MKESTKANYLQRIDQVVEFLNSHIDNTPSLQQLAGIAAISPFHFHRVYRAITGETPAGTIRRLRIIKACLLLKETKKPITDIAFEVGYDSSQAFAKAFRELTGSNASELRADPNNLTNVIERLSEPRNDNSSHHQSLEVKLVSIDPFKVIAHRHIGSQEKLFSAYAHLFAWLEKNDCAKDLKGIYGIPIDDYRDIPESDCRFDCCFDIGNKVKTTGDFSEKSLGGGLYAVLRHTGAYDGLHKKYDYLYGPWLSQSGYSLREQAFFNHYLADPDTLPVEKWETDIYLPISE